MFILLPLLLAIAVTTVSSQPVLKWTKSLPKDYILVPGDTIKLPLDEFINVDGAKIEGKAPYSDVTIQKVQAVKSAATVDPQIKLCTMSVRLAPDTVIFLCDSSRVLAKVKFNTKLGTIVDTPVVKTLVTIPATLLPTSSQQCTDMIIYANNLYISCVDSTKDFKDIIIFKVSTDTLEVSLINTCQQQDASKAFKAIFKMSIFEHTPNSFMILFHDPSIETTNNNVVPIASCILTQNNNTIAATKGFQIATLQDSGVIVKGQLRYLHRKSTTELLYAVASSEGTNKEIIFGILTVDSNGEIKKSDFNNTSWNMTSKADFVPSAVSIISADSTGTLFLMADKASFYAVNITYNTTTTETVTKKSIILGAVTTIPIDCGLSKAAGVYPGEISIEGTYGSQNFRALVEYRTSSATSLAFKEFTVLFGPNKYGCSRSSGLLPDKVDSVRLLDRDWAISVKDKLFSFVKLDKNTYLNLVVKPSGTTATPKKEVTLTASLEGYTDATEIFTFEAFDNVRDVARINFSNPEVKAYNGSKFVLPIPASNFLASAAVYSTAATNVKITHANTYLPDFNITLPENYVINRIISVDHDTFIAILRSTKNEPEAFIRFWSAWKDGVFYISKATPATVLPPADKQIVFKAFKVGADVFCIIFKATSISADPKKKLAYSCYIDNFEGEMKSNNTAIDGINEITDIQVNEGSSRTDLIFINLKEGSGEIKYLPFEVDSSKAVIVRSAATLALPTGELDGYLPLDTMFDFWGDSESNSYINVKMIGRKDEVKPPIIAKLSLDFSQSTPVLRLIYTMPIGNSNVGFCSCKNEIILYNPRNRKIWAMRSDQGQSGASTNGNAFYFPISDYKIVNILQFNCIPEKGVFQILGQDSDSKKYIITYRGGDSISAPRRVHSIQQVEMDTYFIESGFNFDYIVTSASSVGLASVKRSFVVVYPEGPIFTVDNTNSAANYEITIKASTANGDKTPDAEGKIKINILPPKTFAALTPVKKFDIVQGTPIFLDDVSKIDGPVIDIKLATENPNIKLTKRNNKHKTYNLAESTVPDRIYVEKDFMVVQYGESKIKIYGDHAATKAATPNEILTITNLAPRSTYQYKDVGLIGYGNSKDAILVVKYYDTTSSTYNYEIYQLIKTESGNTTTYSYKLSPQVLSTKTDYDSLQLATFGESEVIIALRNKKSYISNFIKLFSFQREASGNSFGLKASATVLTRGVKEIGWYSLVSNNKGQAIIMTHYQGFAGFTAAVWDGKTNAKVYLADTLKTVKLSETEEKHLLVNYLKCWPKVTLTIECMIDTEGIVDYVLEFVFEDTTAATMPDDIIKSINKISEFIMPPQFEIKRADRTEKYYGVLLKKTAANKATSAARILQSTVVDKFTDCDYNIAIFRTDRNYAFTGITCSQFDKFDKVDFAMESEGREYVYFTKNFVAPAPTPKRILQTSETVGANFLSPIIIEVTGPVKADEVKFNFIGLNGEASPENQGLTLAQFQSGAPPAPAPESSSSFWTWFIIILVILLIVGGGLAGWYWYQNQQSSGPSTAYKKSGDANASKEDLEDTRL